MSERYEPFQGLATRRRFVLAAALGGVGALGGGSYVLARALSSSNERTPRPVGPRDRLAAGNVRSGGPRKDGIPPIVGLVWHEIVNDELVDGPMSVTYCPLTRSAVAFRSTAPKTVANGPRRCTPAPTSRRLASRTTSASR